MDTIEELGKDLNLHKHGERLLHDKPILHRKFHEHEEGYKPFKDE